ncbi:HAD-IB family hydrolase [Isoptericola sp. b441]|uniref:HAD-IB family hydrolase n=1 Tax=Actinotalea lenta TaxID=3064654 RepID=A0ABT9D6Q4_9CELL|nr:MULTISPECIES: HAD-IB family hydrolase [unclassified Isoptericola]MDO8106530.1 HAD-IB family hydrolase [Isoptericola sp. b441]MDO8121762.1 HAD-IB family hydrolase [Isoptericola sp. b490]
MPSEDARRVAAVFDLDKTIIATPAAMALSRPFRAGGLLTRRAMLRAAYARAAFELGHADAAATERLRSALSTMVRGWDVATVARIVEETLAAAIAPTVYAEAVALIDDHHARGHDVVIASASGMDVVRPIADLLGAQHVVATRMQVRDGRYTGELEFYAYGQDKADAVRELALAHGYDLTDSYAYTDSVTDLPLLELVGHPTVVNPDRALRRMAEDRGWSVATFARPVALRLPLPRARHTAAIVGTALLGVCVAAWLVRRDARPTG